MGLTVRGMAKRHVRQDGERTVSIPLKLHARLVSIRAGLHPTPSLKSLIQDMLEVAATRMEKGT